MEIKLCNLCGEEKELTLFHKDNRTATGRGTTCLKCVGLASARYRKRHYYRLRATKFGLTEQELLDLYEKQQRTCLGCNTKEQDLTKSLHIDHCHKTGRVRGLLCNDCNAALGFVKDDIKILNNLIAYLKEE